MKDRKTISAGSKSRSRHRGLVTIGPDLIEDPFIAGLSDSDFRAFIMTASRCCTDIDMAEGLLLLPVDQATRICNAVDNSYAGWHSLVHWNPREWSKENYPAVYERDGNECRYCGSSERLSVDHVTPRVSGGDDSIENLVVACRRCNSRKGGRTPERAGMVLRPIERIAR